MNRTSSTGAEECCSSALQTLRLPKGTAQLTDAKPQPPVYPLLNKHNLAYFGSQEEEADVVSCILKKKFILNICQSWRGA